MTEYCFGRRPSAKETKLKFANYVNYAALPPIPADFGHETWDPPIAWGMLGNDRYGDCVLAGAAHEHMLWARMGGANLGFNTDDVLADQRAITGLPNSPVTGTDMQSAASFRFHYGLLGADGQRHKVAAYVALKPGNLRELYAAMYLFGAVGVGLRVTSTLQQQFQAHEAWRTNLCPQWTGQGHYVPCIALRGNIVCVTWGRFQAMRPSFYAVACEEALAYISQEALTNGRSPEGFSYDQLVADLSGVLNA